MYTSCSTWTLNKTLPVLFLLGHGPCLGGMERSGRVVLPGHHTGHVALPRGVVHVWSTSTTGESVLLVVTVVTDCVYVCMFVHVCHSFYKHYTII